MNKFLLIIVIAAMAIGFTGCGSTGADGQLVGVDRDQEWNGVNPFGMSYIPSGTLNIGQADQDINSSLTQRTKSISIQGFYMDNTEITNAEYRQFTDWVRDSIGLTLLDMFEEDELGNTKLDWTYPIDWSGESEDSESLASMYYQGDDVVFGEKELDPRELIYKYRQYDLKRAAGVSAREEARSKYIEEYEVPVSPDKLCWVADFSYSYNEPMTLQYFDHPAFDDYPVVGVNWNQGMAFGAWRTEFWNRNAAETGGEPTEDFRLPFEHEWEYAARGGLEGAPYPWGGPYIRNRKGCLLANFKPGRGNYPEDGGFYTVKVGSYHPNEYGLYDMAGNVAEWTQSAYFENAYSFLHDMNSNVTYDAAADADPTLKRKVIRGGSWKDIGYYLQTGTRHWEYQDTSKSYIGFRCALTFLGRSMSDFNN